MPGLARLGKIPHTLYKHYIKGCRVPYIEAISIAVVFKGGVVVMVTFWGVVVIIVGGPVVLVGAVTRRREGVPISLRIGAEAVKRLLLVGGVVGRL